MMGGLMTEPDVGERQEARRRRIFRMTLGGLFVAGMVLGLFIGIAAASRDVEIGEIWTQIPQSLALSVIAV